MPSDPLANLYLLCRAGEIIPMNDACSLGRCYFNNASQIVTVAETGPLSAFVYHYESAR